MSLHDHIDATLPALEQAFWSSTKIIADQCAITVDDAARHMLRRWAAHLKDFRIHHAIDYADDGRAASWRVRMMIWRIGQGEQADLYADSDPGAAFNQHEVYSGSTVLYGLPAVAVWVRDLCVQAHPGCILAGVDEPTLANKVKSLRVALSNSGEGRTTWRIRYSADAPAQPMHHTGNALRDAATLKPTSQRFRADVQVTREESPRGK